MSADPVLILSAARTPLGAFQGEFAGLAAWELGASALGAAVERAGAPAAAIDEVLMGCVLPAGQGQAPARQASRRAGLPDAVGCTTVNKMCGSGMKAVMIAHDALLAGSVSLVLAGGMESMTNAPYLLPRVRSGLRMGHSQVIDHMFFDGLEDAYERGRLMGTFAEDCAGHFGFTREAQDGFALESLAKAQAAAASGRFAWEITPVALPSGKGDRWVDADETPGKVRPDKIAQLKPAFRKDGTVTAANSSSISDGAAALLLSRATTADRLGLRPIARIVAHATHAQEPAWFTTAPVGAIKKVLARAGWTVGEVDLFEINEAFAVVTMAAIRECALDFARVNVNGGACALGHPIGASGARILVSLIGALRSRGLRRGVAALCIGGGEATAVAVELADANGA